MIMIPTLKKLRKGMKEKDNRNAHTHVHGAKKNKFGKVFLKNNESDKMRALYNNLDALLQLLNDFNTIFKK